MKRNMIDIVETVLDDMELHYGHDGMVFHFTMSDDRADFPISIVALEERDLLMTIGYFPIKVGQQHLDRMCRKLNDINYSTTVGAFVIDPEDGDLSFRITHNTDGGAVNEETVKTCLLQVIARLRDCYEDVMATLYGGPQMSFMFSPERNAAHS
jgi:Uncharacterized conserved protein